MQVLTVYAVATDTADNSFSVRCAEGYGSVVAHKRSLIMRSE